MTPRRVHEAEPTPSDDRAAALCRFFERGQSLIAECVRRAAIDRTNAADHVVFLINLGDAQLRRYIERCGHRVPAFHEAAAVCVPLANARKVLRGLDLEGNLDVVLRAGW